MKPVRQHPHRRIRRMTNTGPDLAIRVVDAHVPLERDGFMRTLLRELSGTLEDVVGIEEARGFISVVGQRIGDQIDRDYRRALQVDEISREEVAEVLVDLKRRTPEADAASGREYFRLEDEHR